MSTVLSNGVIVPDVGSTNWAADLETNWTLLNALIGAVGANVRLDRPNIWTAAQTFSEGIYGDLDGTASMAVSDANGNEIATTYALKTDVTALATAVSGKAADADVVHLAGAETITGDKTFTGAVTFDGWPLATGFQQTKATISTDVAPSSTQYFGYNYANNNDGQTLLHHRAFVSANTLNNTLRYWVRPNTSTGDNFGGFQVVAYGDGSTVATFKPRGNLEPYDTNYGANLGSSSNKWQSLNGINPGALSLPSHSAYIDILSSITHTDWTVNYYTPAINGYIALNVNGCAIIQPYGAYGISAGFYDGTIRINDLRVCLPVIANQTYEIWVLGTVNEARLFACLGNV